MTIKNQAKGHVQKEVMEYNFPQNELPAPLQKNPEAAAELKQKYPYFLKHVGEEIEALPGGQVIPGAKASRL